MRPALRIIIATSATTGPRIRSCGMRTSFRELLNRNGELLARIMVQTHGDLSFDCSIGKISRIRRPRVKHPSGIVDVAFDGYRSSGFLKCSKAAALVASILTLACAASLATPP